MGNCVRKCSHGEFGGGADAAAASDDAAHCAAARKAAALAEEEEAPHGGKGEKAAAPVTEVKIRITRKQLEELLRRVDGAEDGGAVIAELLCLTSSCNFRHRGGQAAGQWTPALHSIPE